MPVVNCKKDCVNQILLVQALARRSHYLNVISGLGTLLTLQNMIDKGLPGWPKMNEDVTNFNIAQHTLAYRKASKNVKQLRAILEEGCVTCQIDLHEVDVQERIASAAEEAVQNFESFLNGDTVTEVLEVLQDIE